MLPQCGNASARVTLTVSGRFHQAASGKTFAGSIASIKITDVARIETLLQSPS
jgi:hypothetical protein